MRLRFLPLVALAVALAGCGGGTDSASAPPVAATTVPPASTAPADRLALALYLLDPTDRKLYAVDKEIEPTRAVGGAALDALAAEPDSEVPPNLSLRIDGGDAKVTGSELSPAARAQVVYTLTQFPAVESVDGLTRKDVEAFAPPILVERPSPEARVTSPLRVRGSANTYEATFEYDLADADGRVLHHNFVTATSGNGERGTFDFTVPFDVQHETGGTLIVYEISAEDGSRTHIRRIPLTLAPS